MSLTLDTYRLLGRSGLRVSPPAWGAATFGTDGGWGAERDEARKLFTLYVERGRNFIDTTSTYTHGSSERRPARRRLRPHADPRRPQGRHPPLIPDRARGQRTAALALARCRKSSGWGSMGGRTRQITAHFGGESREPALDNTMMGESDI